MNHDKAHQLGDLRHLRQRIVADTGALTDQQLYLLVDVCHALGCTEAETDYIIGDRYAHMLKGPVAYSVEYGRKGAPA